MISNGKDIILAIFLFTKIYNNIYMGFINNKGFFFLKKKLQIEHSFEIGDQEEGRGDEWANMNLAFMS